MPDTLTLPPHVETEKLEVYTCKRINTQAALPHSPHVFFLVSRKKDTRDTIRIRIRIEL